MTAWEARICRDDNPGPFSEDLRLSRWVRPIAAWDAVDDWLAEWNIVPPRGVRWERSGSQRFVRSADGGRTPWRFARPGQAGLWTCVVMTCEVLPEAVSDWPRLDQKTPDSTKAPAGATAGATDNASTL
ncbi:hypothetical protein ACRYCC_26015 [Actinomadura scrupuli]|uniref:hypothetical protein n=1 Tax=Actinomadura scrupuli TaxID=559629 RepID=UPI003D963FCD